MAVLETVRRQGIGTELVRAALREAVAADYPLAVLGPTPESQRLYERLGFRLFAGVAETYHVWFD